MQVAYLLTCSPSLYFSFPSARRNIPPTKPTIFPRAEMSSFSQDGHPPFAENGVVLGCGALSVDYLATVDAFPKPDDKIRSTSLKVEGGGNTGNALTCAARLGLKPRLISKIANDAQGKNILTELKGDGVDTSFIVATQRNIPILVDAERKREGLDEILKLATYIVCSEKFPQAWTTIPSIPNALVSMLLRLPKIKFVVVTRGDKGCIMLERSINDAREAKEVEIGSLLESLMQKVDRRSIIPTCISSKTNIRISADGIGSISGRLLVGTAELISPSELIDTTGAGDAFIGAILYALCAGMPAEKMLPFASQVAAAGCRALGARSGLPWHTDPRLAPFLGSFIQTRNC